MMTEDLYKRIFDEKERIFLNWLSTSSILPSENQLDELMSERHSKKTKDVTRCSGYRRVQCVLSSKRLHVRGLRRVQLLSCLAISRVQLFNKQIP